MMETILVQMDVMEHVHLKPNILALLLMELRLFVQESVEMASGSSERSVTMEIN